MTTPITWPIVIPHYMNYYMSNLLVDMYGLWIPLSRLIRVRLYSSSGELKYIYLLVNTTHDYCLLGEYWVVQEEHTYWCLTDGWPLNGTERPSSLSVWQVFWAISKGMTIWTMFANIPGNCRGMMWTDWRRFRQSMAGGYRASTLVITQCFHLRQIIAIFCYMN